jgi:hypothetical protein
MMPLARQTERRRRVHHVGAAARKHAVGTLGEDGAEAHEARHFGDFVAVDKLGIAERHRLHAEELCDRARVLLHLLTEFLQREK